MMGPFTDGACPSVDIKQANGLIRAAAEDVAVVAVPHGTQHNRRMPQEFLDGLLPFHPAERGAVWETKASFTCKTWHDLGP